MRLQWSLFASWVNGISEEIGRTVLSGGVALAAQDPPTSETKSRRLGMPTARTGKGGAWLRVCRPLLLAADVGTRPEDVQTTASGDREAETNLGVWCLF